MGKTKIEWTDQTDNPIRAVNIETGRRGHFCEKISPGCAGCYAERYQMFRGTRVRYARDQANKVRLELDEGLLARIPHYKKPRRIFVCDMTDLFGIWISDLWIGRVLDAYYQLPKKFSIQLLTKRTHRMAEYFESQEAFREELEIPNNFLLGFSAENQEEFDKRWPHMLKLAEAGWTVWCSMEPLLGPIKPPPEYWVHSVWTVTGGESGPKARPSHPDWFRYLRDAALGWQQPFFFKQWGEWVGRLPHNWKRSTPITNAYIHSWPWDDEKNRGTNSYRVGRKLAGRLLDGVEYSQFPELEEK